MSSVPPSEMPSENAVPETRRLPEVSPDVGEMEMAEAMEGAVAVPGYSLLPVVGLGGSAGGITAIQEFLKAMPVDSGMAFVVILHLSPHHVSVLAEIFQRNTGMRVMTAEDGAELKVNCVYVIPEGKHLTSTDGHLRLTEATNPAGKRVAVDLFFRSLADSHGPHSVAVVLSGADGDGAIGIKRVKERGGLTIAQDPDEAEQVGMPRAAIATGMVDWVLKVAEIPGRLLTYRKRGGGAGAADGGGAGSGGEIDFDASGGGAGAAGDSGISAHEDVLRFFLL